MLPLVKREENLNNNKKMEVGNSGKCYREVDEEGRLPLSMVVLGERWTPGNS